MAPQPELHADIYPAVDPANFKGSQKGNVALVIGILAIYFILMTGSARGIGQGVAISFAKAGAAVAVFDLRNTAETVEICKKEGVEANGWELDASNEKAVNAAIDEVEAKLGPIAVLVNCAGIVGSRPVMMEYYSNFWKTMEINTGAVRHSVTLLMVDHDFDVQSPPVDEETPKRLHH
jgi:NADP-dependent 3-hydroxy acid dehydrogenase YdfG